MEHNHKEHEVMSCCPAEEKKPEAAPKDGQAHLSDGQACSHCGGDHHRAASEKKIMSVPMAIIAGGLIIGLAWSYVNGKSPEKSSSADSVASADDVVDILPAQVKIPVAWGELGAQLVSTGVIDREKFDSLYSQRGGVSEEISQALEGNLKQMVMTENNAGEWLNLLWALGLANENKILIEGPMAQYGDTGNFASTGGWSLSKGDPMDHYARHLLMQLTPAQQLMVERVSNGIYRPCCDNSTYFPDCNHGMAMLGLLQLMASQGMSESEMYEIALQVNSYWFPQNYATIAKYYQTRGTAWSKVDPAEALGKDFSSGSGYATIRNNVTPPKVKSGGGGCGV